MTTDDWPGIYELEMATPPPAHAAKCLARTFDDEGRMFYCELQRGHDGAHYREVKVGYRRPYVVVQGRPTTFSAMARDRRAR